MTIKQIRALHGITQRQLSEELGIPLRTIEDWEAGRRKPPEYLAELIREHYENIEK